MLHVVSGEAAGGAVRDVLPTARVFPFPDALSYGPVGSTTKLHEWLPLREAYWKDACAADDDMARILGEEHRAGGYTCVMHCFSSGPALAEATLDLGFYLSMSGIAAFPKSQELRDIFASASIDKVLVETDSPYLAPPPNRGKRNEPSYVADTAAVGAEVFGLSYDDFAARTEANFNRLFAKAVAWPS